MSQFMPESTPSTPSSVVTPQSSVASDADIALMQKVFNAALARPDLVPEGFMAYMQDFIQTSRLTIPIGQILGFSQFAAQAVVVATLETTAVTGYHDLTTPGPTISGLPDGHYLCLWGAYASGSSGPTIASASMAISVNGGAAPQGDNGLAASSTTDVITSMMVADTFRLSAGIGGNSLQAKYATGNTAVTAKFENRFLIALRYSNL